VFSFVNVSGVSRMAQRLLKLLPRSQCIDGITFFACPCSFLQRLGFVISILFGHSNSLLGETINEKIE
jgi:hypothetical protein